MLERAGHTVCEAGDGKTGLREYRTNPADLLITDIVMPDKDGLEIILELWRDYPDAKIIAISGGGAQISSEMCLDYARVFGALKTLAKPVERKTLLDTVNELLGISA